MRHKPNPKHLSKRQRKRLLYGTDGLKVPLSVIKDAYEGNVKQKFYLPPLTTEIVLDLCLKVRAELLKH